MPADSDKTVVMGPRSSEQKRDPDKTVRMDDEFATSVISPHAADATSVMSPYEADQTMRLPTREERIAAAVRSSDPDLSGLDIPADIVVDDVPATSTAVPQVSYVAKAPDIPREPKKPHGGRMVLIVFVVFLIALLLYAVFINPYFFMNLEYLARTNVGEPLSGPLSNFASTVQHGAVLWANNFAAWVKGLF